MSSGLPIIAAEGNQMKEFFQNGKHGYTWEPNDLNSAISAFNSGLKSREALVENCRENALKHSWTAAGQQIEDIYQEIKDNQLSKERSQWSVLMVPFRLAFYMIQWTCMMLLIIFVIMPFLKVSKPKADMNLATKRDDCKITKRRNKSCSINTRCVGAYSFLREQLSILNFLEADLMRTFLFSSACAALIGAFYLKCTYIF